MQPLAGFPSASRPVQFAPDLVGPLALLWEKKEKNVALIECLADLTHTHYKVRRLHLVIVDL